MQLNRLLCVFVLAAKVLAAATQKAGDMTIEPYVFQAASGEKADAEMGRLLVPENRANPTSRLIELAFVRFKSTAAQPGPPIVYLAGGPGGSGIAAARSTRFPLFQAMREIADVIALDQRGTGRSKPSLGCGEMVNYPLDKPASPEAVLPFFREAARACAQRWKDEGVDLTGYTTNESADDLDALRKALGVPKISLWSISYGTHLAFATIRRHEKNLHRVVLAGTEGPDHTLKLPSNIQKDLEKIHDLVKADPHWSQKIPSFLEMVRTVLARLEKEPMTVEVADPRTKEKVKLAIGKFDLQLLTANSLGSPEIVFFPASYQRMAASDFSMIAPLLLRMRRSSVGTAMGYVMDCASGASPQRLERIRREARDAILGDAVNFPHPGICTAWGAPDVGATFRSPLKASVPALFISGTLDARTPVSNAEEVRKGFSNSAHVIIEGAVHSDPLFLSSPKILEVMLQFMKGEALSTTRISAPPVKFAEAPLPR